MATTLQLTEHYAKIYTKAELQQRLAAERISLRNTVRHQVQHRTGDPLGTRAALQQEVAALEAALSLYN